MSDFRMKPGATIFAVTIAMAFVPSVAAATEGEAAKLATTEHEAHDSDKLICRTVEVIGSRLKTGRVCLTSQQWAAKRQEDRDALQRGQTQRWKSE